MSASTPKEIEILARGVAVRNGQVLLCRNRKHGHGYLPGGHVEPGETAAVALAREFLEETGLEVRVGELLVASENLFDQRDKPRHEYTLVFHVEHASGPWPESVLSQEDKLAFEWVEIAALPESHFVPPSILAWLVAGGPGSSADRWISHRQGG